MTTITEDYVSFEIAKLLKEKGFNGKCIAYYLAFNENIKFYECSNLGQGLPYIFNDNWRTILRNPLESGYAAPTLQMAMKWLRIKHNIHIESFCPVVDTTDEPVKYNVVISDLRNYCLAFNTPLEDKEFDSYEQACEAAIKYCLENLI